MNIKKISEIHCFYAHLLAKIRMIENNFLHKNKPEDEKKYEILNWLSQHKTNKSFGENVRHEIFHMLEMVANESFSRLERKISILEHNCERIVEEMDGKQPVKTYRYAHSIDLSRLHYHASLTYKTNCKKINKLTKK